MRRLLPALALFASVAFAEDPTRPPELEDILGRLISKDAFTAYQARQDLRTWAAGVGDGSLEKIREARLGAQGSLADALDEALEVLGKTPPPEEPERKAAALADILDRMGLDDRDVVRAATEDFDDWASRNVAEARALVTASANDASPMRKDGIRRALDRLDLVDRVKVLEGDPKTPEEKWLVGLVAELKRPDEIQVFRAQRELERWAVADPKRAAGVLRPWTAHPDARVARPMRTLVGQLEAITGKGAPLLEALDALAIPKVTWRKRVSVSATTAAPLPILPGSGDAVDTRVWMQSSSPGLWVALFDDGCERQGKWERRPASFSDELAAIAEDTVPDGDAGAHAVWKALLAARWSLEDGLFADANRCLDAALAGAERLWSRENAEQWGQRVLEIGAGYLLRYALEEIPDEDLDRARWERLASVPVEAVRQRGEEGLRRLTFLDEYRGRWSGVAEREVVRMSTGEQADYWLWRLVRDSRTRTPCIPDLVESLDAPSPFALNPEERLAALGCGAVPQLVARLGDRSSCSVRFGNNAGTLSDVCRLLLWRILGDPAKPSIDPATGALSPLVDPRAFQVDLLARWESIARLEEPDQWFELLKDHSPRAESWLLVHRPALVLPFLLEALPAGGRSRAMGMRRLESRLQAAPVDVLEELRQETDGEQRDLAERALGARRAAK